MNATSGQSFVGSLASVGLQSSLESKLQVLTAGRGSILYALTWKRWTLPSQRQICALRASALRTSDSDCTGRPSPTANDARGSAYTYSNGNHDKPSLKLLGAARLAGWPTPQARDGHRRKGQAKRNFRPGSPSNLEDKIELVIRGPAQSGSTVQTERAGLLNPEFSRWLMGYPNGWVV